MKDKLKREVICRIISLYLFQRNSLYQTETQNQQFGDQLC